MKRQQDHDSPSKSSKRSRSSVPRFEDSPREHSPRSPSHGGASGGGKPNSSDRSSRHGKNRTSSGTGSGGGTPDGHLAMPRTSRDSVGREPRDDYSRMGSSSRSSYLEKSDYRILCISGISNHRGVSESAVRETLFREFKKYGEIDVKLVTDNGERFGYVYFRTPEDAREARHAKSKLVLFEKPVLVEPILEAGSGNDNRRGRSSRNSLSPDMVGSYPVKSSRPRGISPSHSTSSSSSLQRRSRRHGSMERGSGGLPPPLHPHHAQHHHHHHDGPFRRDSGGVPLAPPPHGHPDFLSPHAIQPAVRRHDEKKEKFPNYLHHIPPEEDDKANRTLFIGNLEVNITEPELRRIFERFGVVEDVDIKRPPPGQGNAYAFVKYLNLDMAHKAKVEMSGQYIGKFQCKIGYGKPIPTTRIWVGGLGPWTSLSHLEREFDRFGAIKKIDFIKGDNHAYILYDSIDAAQAACKEMRGFPLGGPSKRLRVDFADAGPYNYQQSGQPARPPPSPYSAEEEHYYRSASRTGGGSSRLNHDLPALRGAAADPYYYASSRDPEYSRWPAGDYASGYDAYYDRGRRGGRIHDEWAAYERDRHDDYGWGREYVDWRDGGGGGREWSGGGDAPRRKRPRSPDDLHYDVPPRGAPVGDPLPPEGSYSSRRYSRQRTPPDGPLDMSPPHLRRRRSPSPLPRGYRSRDMSRERDITPLMGVRVSNVVGRDRRRSRTPEPLMMDRERPSRSQQMASRVGDVDVVKNENGRAEGSRDGPLSTTLASSSSAGSSTAGGILLADGQAERLARAASVSEVARILPLSWQGGLVLKNSFFPIRMHACEGDAKLFDTLTKDASSGVTQVLRITQRLRLDQPKLDDVGKRLTGSGFCILLGVAVAGSEEANVPGGAAVQQRPLRNLVTYLKQKEASGVIGLAGGKGSQGVLYAFPPCRFSQERLHRIAPALSEDAMKEDHLLIAVVRGAI